MEGFQLRITSYYKGSDGGVALQFYNVFGLRQGSNQYGLGYISLNFGSSILLEMRNIPDYGYQWCVLDLQELPTVGNSPSLQAN